MRCRQARIRLEKQSKIDAELIEHLNGCPECSQLARAQDLLNSSFRSLRSEPEIPSSSLAVIRAQMATLEDSKEQNIMASLKDGIKSHPRLGLGVTFGLLALLFLVLVPLPYQRVSGYSVQIGGIDPSIPTQELAQAIKALGYENISIKAMISPDNATLAFSNLPNLKAARGVVAAVKSLTGTEDAPEITPQFETVSASLYAQAREKMIKIEVDGTGKTDEQIKAEIESKLAAQGCDKPLVYFKREPGGKKNIQMELKTNDCSNVNPSQQTLEIDARDKTDDQIKAEIQAKLAAEGHQNAQVSITTTGSDSTLDRKIEIQLSDSTGQ
jgi:hypothetical protein